MTALMLAAMLMAAEAPKVPKAQHLELGPDDTVTQVAPTAAPAR